VEKVRGRKVIECASHLEEGEEDAFQTKECCGEKEMDILRKPPPT
jgi:hypothetical protein